MPFALCAAALLSGASALICEVVWARPLRLLVGDTALAVALVLAVLFAGMATGAWVIGGIAPRVRHPLRLCALLEILLALAAVVSVPALLKLGDLHFAVLREVGRWANVPLGLIEAALLLGPAAALMGGTVPLLLQAAGGADAFVQTPRAARLYSWNTLGAAGGALVAGIALVPHLGLWQACGVASLCNVAAAALMLSARVRVSPESLAPERSVETELSARLVAGVALGAGVCALGLEVVWSRVLSAVVSNTAESLALMLGSVLLGLALGAAIAARLDLATRWAPLAVLQIALGVVVLLIGFLHDSALLALASARHWFGLTGWSGALASEGLAALALSFLPSVILGINLPLLFAAWPGPVDAAGRRWGRLVALNMVGAVAGSLLAALVLIPVLQIKGATAVLAATGLVLGLMIWRAGNPAAGRARAAVALALIALLSVFLLKPATPPLAPGQRLLARHDGIGATVSVTESLRGDRSMLVNDRYVLGGTGGRMLEFRQALIPALLHPRPERVFHLGMGTGHTAGVLAQAPGVSRLVTCENLPGVIRFAEEWFGNTNIGLFDQPNVEVVGADGRHWLSATDETFDVIIVDNLLPWLAGAGHLQTREFAEIARAHLREGGILCVWLPMHQIDAHQLALANRTLAEVFPEVHLWIARPEVETSIGLIAASQPLAVGHLLRDRRLRSPAFRNALEIAMIDGVEDVFAGLSGVNPRAGESDLLPATDNHPRAEHMAAATLHRELARHPEIFTAPAQAELWRALAEIRAASESDLTQGLQVTGDDSPGAPVLRRWQSFSLLVEGMAALGRGDERTASLWLSAARDDPDHRLARRGLEWLLTQGVREQRWRDVGELGEECAALFDLSHNARVAWAEALFETGRRFRARRALEEILEEDPGHLAAGLTLIRVLTADGRHDEAREIVQHLYDSHPDSETVRRLYESLERGL